MDPIRWRAVIIRLYSGMIPGNKLTRGIDFLVFHFQTQRTPAIYAEKSPNLNTYPFFRFCKIYCRPLLYEGDACTHPTALQQYFKNGPYKEFLSTLSPYRVNYSSEFLINIKSEDMGIHYMVQLFLIHPLV